MKNFFWRVWGVVFCVALCVASLFCNVTITLDKKKDKERWDRMYRDREKRRNAKRNF